MMRLAAFADEISPDLDEQIRVCRETGVTHFELRSVFGKNVLDFDADLRRQVKSKLAAAGLGVCSIGSPIGKVRIDEPFEPHWQRFKTAVELAEFFDASLIRLFSYYPPAGGDILKHRQQVMDRFRAKVDFLAHRPITLVHENEVKIFGEKAAQCLDLMQTIDSPKLRLAFDFANFVQAGQRPLDHWPALRPFVAHVHVKDALLADGKVVPAGQGDGQLEPILIDLKERGYEGFLSLEPHLKLHGHSGGFSG
ncbi:MAG TPA: sugar phosphate isomerase/epimerase family protein, partial [Tepidisphaeraceae bacterium]|nr:sugar phosphate isomerase/epimerase family protein [Tepidisphaeraceae bacterium]